MNKAQSHSDDYDAAYEKSAGLQNKMQKLLTDPQTMGTQAQIQNLGNSINTAEGDVSENLKRLKSYNDYVSNPKYVNTIANDQLSADRDVADSVKNFNIHNDRIAKRFVNATNDYNNSLKR